MWFQWTVPRWTRTGSICHSSGVFTTQISARDDDDANIDFSTQHDVSATWKLSEKMNPAGVNSTYTTNYPMQYSWDLRAVLGSRMTEGSCWKVLWSSWLLWPCTKLGNSTVLDFKEGKLKLWWISIVHKEKCNSLFLFWFCRSMFHTPHSFLPASIVYQWKFII